MTPTQSISVVIVDDHPLVRSGFAALLGGQDHINFQGEASDGAGALALIREKKPDVVLLDIRLPDIPGYEVCRMLKQEGLASRILMLTSYLEDELVFQTINSGADGYVLKEINGPELIRSIERLAEGESVLDPSVTDVLFTRIRGDVKSEAAANLSLLSKQEYRVLEQVSKGLTNKEIAAVLNLSDKTIKNYLRNAMEKIGASRRTEAAAIFIRNEGKPGTRPPHFG